MGHFDVSHDTWADLARAPGRFLLSYRGFTLVSHVRHVSIATCDTSARLVALVRIDTCLSWRTYLAPRGAREQRHVALLLHELRPWRAIRRMPHELHLWRLPPTRLGHGVIR